MLLLFVWGLAMAYLGWRLGRMDRDLDRRIDAMEAAAWLQATDREMEEFLEDRDG